TTAQQTRRSTERDKRQGRLPFRYMHVGSGRSSCPQAWWERRCQKPPLHMPVTVGANRPMHTRQRGDAAGDRTLIRAVAHHPMSTHVLPNVSASIAPGPAALAHDTSIEPGVVESQSVV